MTLRARRGGEPGGEEEEAGGAPSCPLARSSHPAMLRGLPSRTTIPTTDSATTPPFGALSLQSASIRPASAMRCTSRGRASATMSPGRPSQIARACVPLPPKLRRQRTATPVFLSYSSENICVILA
jgi:hypothetical protein